MRKMRTAAVRALLYMDASRKPRHKRAGRSEDPWRWAKLTKNNLKGTYYSLQKLSLQYDFFNPEEHYLRYLGWVAIDLNNEREEKFLPAECVYNAADNYGSANVAETKTSGKLTVATEHGLTWQSRFLNDDHNCIGAGSDQLTSTTSHSQYVKMQDCRVSCQ